ncbi:AzlC family ABC transporter permease [Pseudooceanicola sp. CBS1P-1]|uniref:Branched-chain amino acid ABC transporter permease n=1 Tax=Pseudooceanicola albus TaxID=2692189 RepID=A0A6L7G3R2_9RHOB|nr:MULTISPECIES: AzlC family ABC transporter permease [Pseudooceanicola]MBT9384848.1 AzlC family ABC transporter permease [Pseudooceanicola endophyticus]MXN18158.1 branched-chain amino acid ABC transporter permease [Pseudooceanicola albus]
MSAYAQSPAPASARRIFLKGVTDGLPFVLVITPFGLLFGVVATEAGLQVHEALTFSVAVIAGAAQFTALQLLQHAAPVLIVLVSALTVNLRMAMYSASLTPYIGAAPLWQRALVAYLLVDQTYACAVTAYEKHPEWTVRDRLAYFFGVAAPIVPPWYLLTLIGARVGDTIPPEWSLDFAVPITFIALVAPMLRTLPHLAACFTAVVLSLLLAGLPWNLGLLAAALLGMMAGAATERHLAGRNLP